ncbi:MAG: choice-of-anchor I family protein [Saprospiraceae bacterium]
MAKRFTFLTLISLFLSLAVSAQIARNGFEGDVTDTWNYTAEPSNYNLPADDDIWDDTTAVSVMDPLAGNQFWFMRDLNNPNGGGNFFHTLTFETVDISATNAGLVSFGWNSFEYEAGDSIGYIIAFDDGTDWDMANYVDLDRNTGSWQLVQVPIPPGTQFVRLRLMAKQNGNDDYAGFDEVQIEEGLPPATIEFDTDITQVDEDAGTVSIQLNITNAGLFESSVKVSVSAFSTAINGTDYDFTDAVYTFEASTGNPVQVDVPILDDGLMDAGRYLVLTLSDFDNADAGAKLQHIILINDNDIKGPAPLTDSFVKMRHLGSFPGSPDGGSAEISAYDPASRRLFITNITNNTLDILDLKNPVAATYIASIDMSIFGGGINSVAVKNGVVACAVEAAVKTDNGSVVFFNAADGTFLSSVTVGALPDMVIFNHDGTQALTANEGEPDDDYLVDPLGSVSIIDLTPGVANLTDTDVTTLAFDVFDGEMANLMAAGVRIYGPNATVGSDLEPEYICISPDGQTALVTLQENNAVAVVDLENLQITAINPLGTKDHSLIANTLDASNTTPGIFMANWPVKGYYLPDAMECFEVGGVTYAVTANEGDTRDYGGYGEEDRVGGVALDPTAFPNADILQNNALLGRLLITTSAGDTDGDGDYDEIYSIGGRSFSIWNTATGQLVWDSGDQLERITAEDPTWGPYFNSSNGTNTNFKNRSDDKGPEPESVVVENIEGRWYAFVGLERIGGVMLYDVTDPNNPVFIQYLNTRNPAGGGDLGPEGLIFIPKNESPNQRNLLVVSNEISGTVSVFQIDLDRTNGGDVTLDEYEYVPATFIAEFQNDTIFDGGLSGLHYIPGTDREFFAVSDRGPNADASGHPNATGTTLVFPAPDYAPLITRFKVENGGFTVQSIEPILRPDGTPISGLPLPPNAGSTGETAWADTTPVVLTPDIWGMDSEGIVEDSDGNLWLCDEYGASVWYIDGTTYQVIKRYTPFPMEAEDAALPAEIGKRRPNRGFEGVAVTPNGKAYAILQDPAYNPNAAAGQNSRLTRIVEIDPATDAVQTYVYEMNDQLGQIRKQDWKVGDLVAINNHEFLLLEHAERNGWNAKNIYKIDISEATPIDTFTFGGQTLEQLVDAATLESFGAKAAEKTFFFDLLENGWDLSLDKPEGLTILNDTTIAVVNDNDFAIDSPAGDGSIVYTGKKTKLYIYGLSEKLGIRPVVTFNDDVIEVAEGDGDVNLGLEVSEGSRFGGSVTVSVVDASTAADGDDYVLGTTTFDIPPFAEGDLNFTVNIPDNGNQTGGRYLILKIDETSNARTGDEPELIVLINDNDLEAPVAQANPYAQMAHLGSFPGSPDGGSAEISAYDPVSQRLFITNITNNTLDIVDFSDPGAGAYIESVDMSIFGGGINSVAVKDGIVAAAVQGNATDDPGKVVFFDADGTFINDVTVGFLPDMVVFTHDGTKALTANEGEPNSDYTIDPVGSISVIDLTPGIANLTNANVTTLGFDAFDSQIDDLKAAGVRIFGPNATVSQDLEPEYICVSDDDLTALVTLQEANALAVVDLVNLEIVEIRPLGTKDLTQVGNVQDVSDRSPGIFFASWPVKSFYLPDAIECFEVGGVKYAITANEGDTRDYDGYSEEERVKDLDLDPAAFPHAEYLQKDALLGRMLTTSAQGDTDGDGDFDEIFGMGGRSFTIWNVATGSVVYDSGDDFEQIVAADPMWSPIFNASNSNATFKNRSDDKGPEPESVLTAEIDGRVYAFIGLERIGGVMLYEVTDPANPQFVQYINTRDLTGGGDLGPEGLIFIPYNESPNGKNLVVVSNEISGTLSVFELNLNCTVTINTGSDVAICEGETATLEVPDGFETYEWSTGSTETSIGVTAAGTYTVTARTAAGCEATDDVVVTLLQPTSSTIAQTLCPGESITVNGTVYNEANPVGAEILVAANAAGCDSTVNINLSFYPVSAATVSGSICEGESYQLGNSQYTTSGTYSETFANASVNGCDSIVTLQLTVNPLPAVDLGDAQSICEGETATLDAGPGFASYEWSTAETSQTIEVGLTGTFSVVVTDANGCSNSDEAMVTVNPLPTVDLGPDVTVVDPETAVLDAGAGFAGYLWSDGSTGQTLTATESGTYAVTVTDANGCTGADEVVVTIEPNAIHEATLSGQLVLFPNPTSGWLNLAFSEFEAADYTIGFYDVTGRLLLSQNLVINAAAQNVRLNLNAFSKGTYLVKISSEKGVLVRRFLVQ